MSEHSRRINESMNMNGRIVTNNLINSSANFRLKTNDLMRENTEAFFAGFSAHSFSGSVMFSEFVLSIFASVLSAVTFSVLSVADGVLSSNSSSSCFIIKCPTFFVSCLTYDVNVTETRNNGFKSFKNLVC